jgi:hypothetical protein
MVIGVTGTFHSELGATPTAGRLLVPADMDLNAFQGSAVAVLGYGFWQRRFGGDPNVIGSTVRVQGAPFTVVGVGPRGFKGFGLLVEPDVTVPLTANPRDIPRLQRECQCRQCAVDEDGWASGFRSDYRTGTRAARVGVACDQG